MIRKSFDDIIHGVVQILSVGARRPREEPVGWIQWGRDENGKPIPYPFDAVGYHHKYYFQPRYIGPDENGVEPIFQLVAPCKPAPARLPRDARLPREPEKSSQGKDRQDKRPAHTMAPGGDLHRRVRAKNDWL